MPSESRSSDPSARAASIYARYLVDLDEDADADIEELCAGQPELEEELRRLHQAHERVENALFQLGQSGLLNRSLESRFGSKGDGSSSAAEAAEVEAFSSEVVRRLARRTGTYGRYRVKKEVARGGMGSILRVWDEDLRRHLAMKVMLTGEHSPAGGVSPKGGSRALGRFLEEAQVTGQLDHPGIVPVHELGLDPQGRVYFTMKLVKGRTLKEVLELAAEGDPAWSLPRVLGVILRVCEAMSYAHAKGVIHRDLKPSNIMVGRFGEVYVMDWGLAKLLRDVEEAPTPDFDPTESSFDGIDLEPDSPLYTMDGDVVGTPAYMAPEQAKGRVAELGPHSDVYSVGAILYHLLSGQIPFEEKGSTSDNRAIWKRLRAGPPPSLATLAPQAPGELISICEKAMRRDIAGRFATIQELSEELRAYTEGRVVQVHETGLAVELRKWVERNRLASAALAAAALIFLVGAGAVYWSQLSKLSAVQAATTQKKQNLVIQADYAIDNARLEEAELRMAEYRGLDPDDFLPHLVLARGYSQFLRTAQAEEEFLRAEAKGFVAGTPEPGDAQGFYLRGLALMIERDPAKRDEAARCYEEAIRLDPRMRAAYFPLYSVQKELGRMEAAGEALAAFQEILPTGDPYYRVVSAIRAELEGNFQDAIDVLVAVENDVVESGQRAALHLDKTLGRLYVALGRQAFDPIASPPYLDKAEQYLRDAVTAVSSDAGSWANLGKLELLRQTLAPEAPESGEWLENALEYGERAADEHPKFPFGHSIIVEALVSLGRLESKPSNIAMERFERAREVAEHVSALDPDHPGLDGLLAQIDLYYGFEAKQQGDLLLAEDYFRSCIELDPNLVRPRFFVAIQDYSRGENEAAFHQLQEARSMMRRLAGGRWMQQLQDEARSRIHIWTFGLAGLVNTPEAIEEGAAARRDIDAMLAEERSCLDIELLNYVEFLASSPAPQLRNCDEAYRLFEDHELERKLSKPAYKEAIDLVHTYLDECE